MNDFTEYELRRWADLRDLVPEAPALSIIEREFPDRHPASSWRMAWQNMHGELHPSELMVTIGRERGWIR
jgi:hypothetical protein